MSKKIMVVDDEEDIRYSLKLAVEMYDDTYEVILANGGENCLQLLNEGQVPDIILLDLMMPGMDGFTVFDKLKAKDSAFSKIPVVFLTAKKDKDSVDVGCCFGEDYIEKPFEIEDLLSRIEKVLNDANN